MKASLVNDDKSLRWDEVLDPILKPEEVLVEIHAAALNRADLMQREGDYPPPPGCPEWMGLEIAGVIVEIGEEAKEDVYKRQVGIPVVPGFHAHRPRQLHIGDA